MNTIDILIPTRNRYDRLIELFVSLNETISEKNIINVYLYIDDDDRCMLCNLYEFYRFCELSEFDLITYIGDKHTNLSQKWNKLAEISEGNIFLLGGDDLVFQTKNWDERIVEEFEKIEDKIGLIYADDGIKGEELATHSFVSRKHIEILGYWLPPLFPANYNDTFLFHIYKEISRLRYLPDVKIEHKHFSVYPELMDSTYNKAVEKYDEAKKIWESEKVGDMKREAIKQLKKYIEDFKNGKIL